MNFIKAKEEVLTEYGITHDRLLSDGDGIKHFETSSNVWLLAKSDNRVTYWTEDALTTYIQFVLGEGVE
jgi:hypothetical protein